MRIISEVTEPEFESHFLSSEWYKPFYDPVREKFDGIVKEPDLDNWEENYYRKELLWKWRSPLLGQLPFGINWYSVELELEEFEQLLVIKEQGWNQTFGLGKNLVEAAQAVRNGVPDNWEVNFGQIKDIKDKIGSYQFKERIIIIALTTSGPFTVIEGNHRVVAFALKKLETGESAHIPREFILGVSTNMSQAYWLNSR